jgi:rhodanese-related sulfurtransferase
MKHISVQALKQVLQTEQSNNSVDFINVCTPVEYAEKHIDGIRNVPLDTLAKQVSDFDGKQTIYVHCRSGNRSKQAIALLSSLGVTAELVNVEGGLMAWDDAGFDTQTITNRLPIMRQVFIVAGSLILIGQLLSVIHTPSWTWISTIVGIGLTFAGVTGWCGMYRVLSLMPWNKS